MNMFRIIRAAISPSRAIAAELRIIRELYELDLASRGLYRITETASKGDTEISYSDVDEPRKKANRWMSSHEQDDLMGDES